MSTTVTKGGIVEALSANVRPDLRPPGMGACTCPPGTLYAGCKCSWGVAIDRLLDLGYRADPATIARDVSDTAAYVAETVAPAAKRAALTTLARQWPSTLAAFAKMLGVTAAAVRKASPAAARMISERAR
jgi:hypothetical protein